MAGSRREADAYIAWQAPVTHAQLLQYLSLLFALPIYAMPLVARSALVAVLTVKAVPPVYSIGTTSGGPYAAMPDKVTNNSPDNRTPNATARSRIRLTCEGIRPIRVAIPRANNDGHEGAGKREKLALPLAEATGWIPHTTRAALTGLRKRGFAVERIRRCRGARTGLTRQRR